MAARRNTRPVRKRRIGDAQIAVRLSLDLLNRLDAEVGRLQAARPGLAITRSDAVREILFAHLSRQVSR